MVWRLSEDFPVEDCEKEGAFSKILERLDRNVEYDDRVLLPNDFESYFTNLQRKPQQSLLAYVTDHDEATERSHKITLPSQVQGWHLLKRANLTREQRQMVTTLEKPSVVEALFLLYGQDYKAGGWSNVNDRRPQRWKGRGYAAFDDDAQDPNWEEAYYEEDWYENDEPYLPEYEETAFDEDAVYFGGDEDPNDDLDGFEDDPAQMAEAFDSAYATYVDAPQRFNQLKLTVVALTDGQPTASPTSSTSTGKGRDKGRGKGKGKSKGKGSNVIRYPPSTGGKSDPKGRASQHDLSPLWTSGSLGCQLPSEPQTEQQEARTHQVPLPQKEWLCSPSMPCSSSRMRTELTILRPLC